jgi:hypothetical protein
MGIGHSGSTGSGSVMPRARLFSDQPLCSISGSPEHGLEDRYLTSPLLFTNMFFSSSHSLSLYYREQSSHKKQDP